MSTTSDITIGKSKHTCKCGENSVGDPVMDARTIPHEVRHAAIFGALDSLQPGSALVVIASHKPTPLIHQAEKRYTNLTVEHLVEGPEEWKVRFARV